MTDCDSLKFTLDVRDASGERLSDLNAELISDQLWDVIIGYAENMGLHVNGTSNPSQDELPVRQEANLDLVDLIETEVRRWPDLRFGQILANLGIIEYLPREGFDGPLTVRDPFHEESAETLRRVTQVREQG